MERAAVYSGAEMTEQQRRHFKAVRMLAATTIFWSMSFPLVKAIGILQSKLLPESTSWFHASVTGVVRFGAAAVVILLLSGSTIRRITRLELWQGFGLGFFAGGGILLQMDGLAHTSASTSAFLTQGFCVLVPLIVAIRDRSLPSLRLVAALVLMMGGVSVLSNLDLKTFTLGRGEAETLLSAVFFAAQIVWLERPVFARNNANHFSFVMFAVMALLSLPILLASARSWRDPFVCYSHPGVLIIAGTITLFCTIIAFLMMNRWQPIVPASEAAIIYGAEPVFASLLALFLPGLISHFTAINYPNEILTWELLAGGCLIIGANLLLQIKWTSPRYAALGQDAPAIK